MREILDRAATFLDDANGGEFKKVPLLHGKSVFNVFFENSTRTRTTFEIAAKKLSADVVNLNIGFSSPSKGETLLETVDNLCAMHADMFVVRHSSSGAAHLIASHVAPQIHVINAGDGRHSHPTQALLDMYTIRHYKKEFHNLRVAIIGDILHSRVARSQIHALTTLGVPEVRVIAPKTLLPTHVEKLGVQVDHDMNEGLKDVDAVMTLRLQNERMQGALLPSRRSSSNPKGRHRNDCAGETGRHRTHPGPMNRGVEIESSVADGPQAVILPQVTFGVAVRDGGMSTLAGREMNIHIKNGRLIDPKNQIDTHQDVFIVERRIAAIGTAPEGFVAEQVIDASGLIVMPGLVDVAARLREPGYEYRATLESEMNAAVAGGVTSLSCPAGHRSAAG